MGLVQKSYGIYSVNIVTFVEELEVFQVTILLKINVFREFCYFLLLENCAVISMI